MFVQMIDILRNPIVERCAYGDIVEERKMLNVLAQPDPAGMGTDRHTEFRRHENHGEHFVDPSQPTTVDLTEADRVRLQKLFEDDAILAGFAGGDTDVGLGPFPPPRINLG